MDDRTPAERIDPAIHIDQDDPRYDGFRIREYWILTAVAPDNQEAPLFLPPHLAQRFHLSVGPAMAADQRRLVNLREFAKWARDELGWELRLRHFVPEGEDEVFGTEVQS